MRAPLAVLCAALVACGLDVNGAAEATDAGGGDASFDAGVDARADGAGTNDGGADAPSDATPDAVPPTCMSIDTSCLGVTVPSGWALAGSRAGHATCPPNDFDPIALVTNARLHPDSCACAACQTQGQYACSSFVLKFGQTCGGTTLSGSTTPSCVAHSESGSNARVSALPGAPSGSVSCTSAQAGTGAVDSDPLTLCRPNKCTADYCGLKGKGFATCIVHDGVVACPAGFPQQTVAGTGAGASCDPCSCNVLPAGACTGKIRVYDNVSNCDGNGNTMGQNFKGEYAADGICVDPMSNFDSIYYVAGPPPPTACAPSMRTNGTGAASLSAQQTICCTQ